MRQLTTVFNQGISEFFMSGSQSAEGGSTTINTSIEKA
jgi:hypothetical protein